MVKRITASVGRMGGKNLPTGEGIKPYRGPEFEQLSEAARKHTPTVHSW